MGKQYRGPILTLSILQKQDRERAKEFELFHQAWDREREGVLKKMPENKSVNIGNPDSKGMFWPDQLSSKDAGTTPSYEKQSLGPLKTQSLRK